MNILIILGLSTFLQFSAAVLALRLIRANGWRIAWTFLSIAIFLMAIQSGITLFRILNEETTFSSDPTTGLVTLAMSIFMVSGIGLITPCFLAIHKVHLEDTEAKEKYSYLYENAHDMYASMDANSGKIIECNQTLADKLGLSKTEILGKPMYNVYHPSYRDKFQMFIKTFVEKGVVEDEEMGLLKKNGKILETILNVSSIKDENGRPKYSLSVWHDISHLKKIEEEIKIAKNIINTAKYSPSIFIGPKPSKQLFEQMLNELLDISGGEYGFIGEVLIAQNGDPYLKTHAITNIAWNDETRKFYNQHSEMGLEFHNMDTLFGCVITSKAPVISNDPKNDPRAGGQPPEHPAMKRFLGVPINFEDKIIGMVGLANKLTAYDDGDIERLAPYIGIATMFLQALRNDRKRIKAEEVVKNHAFELEAINEELNLFIYSASHDFKEPLRKISIFGDLIDISFSNGNSKEGKGYIERMQASTVRLQSLIDSLQIYSQAAFTELRVELIDLEELAKEVVEDLEIMITEVNGSVQIKSLPKIHADPVRMRQLFQNLISNGIKFCKKDAPPVVSIEAFKVEDNAWKISFVDNGIGIEENFLKQIFKPFKRLHNFKEYPGTGIGLFICEKVVKQHSGNIVVQSQPGKGTQFTVFLPEKQIKKSA